MNKDVINKDEQGELNGKQIWFYHPCGNISWIENYHHGKQHGYEALFNRDNSIIFKLYYNMGKWIYSENHNHKQIKIKI